MNGSNVASDIEASINQHLGIRTALEIPDIYLNNDYIRFQECLNNTGTQSEGNVIKDAS